MSAGVDTTARTLAADLGFVEGPSLLPSGALVAVSLDHQCLYEVSDSPATALVEISAAPNGSTVGADGTVYLAAFSGAWPARPECDGTPGIFAWRGETAVETISTAPAAPNDLCFGPDGCLYVTDPVRGGGTGRLWRIDVETGAADVLATVDWYPNGIGFDADDNLWVADMAGRRLVGYAWTRAGLPDPFSEMAIPQGKPDGFAFDTAGNVVVAAPGTPDHPASSVVVLGAGGELVAVLLDGGPAHYTNVAVSAGGTAYVTEAQQGRVLALDGACEPGLPLHPFR